MAPMLLKNFSLGLDAEAFLDHFWYRTGFYEKFLVEKLKDLGVQISDWDPPLSSFTTNNGNDLTSCTGPNSNMISSSSGAMTPMHQVQKRQRTVISFHPAKISFPGLPSHAESIKKHTIEVILEPSVSKIKIHEVNSFRGIPYSDYFNVVTLWEVSSMKNANSMALSKECEVSIFLDFEFLKYTWLQGTIESNTKAELTEVFDLWYETASHYLRLLLDNNSNMQNASSIHLASQQTVKSATFVAEDIGIPPRKAARDQIGQQNRVNAESDIPEEDGQDAGILNDGEKSRYVFDDVDLVEVDDSEGSDSDSLDEEDDLLFYDCEDGGGGSQFPTSRSRKSLRNGSGSGSNSVASLNEMLDYYNYDSGHDHSSGKNRQRVSSQERFPQYGEDPTRRLHSRNRTHHKNTHELAVQIVETVFVFMEFAFWQVYQFYVYDLKELFNIDPSRVWFRAINSFIPGWHLPLIAHPDLYGPLLAVFILPQTLLLSTETIKHGCESTSQLGNAVIVSLFIWVGLSVLYRLLAIFVAPTITFKHSLSMIGYSFFAWNVALLCALPLEQYRESPSNNALASSTSISTALLPLVIFGIPASIAQGYMFWEQTPPSTLVLQPSSFPQSMQSFASTHAGLIQRFIWALPKIIAFILVAGTHYQLLWYIARIFLPGRRQLCRLASLIKPSTYAAILSQKELRKFALDLLSGDRK